MTYIDDVIYGGTDPQTFLLEEQLKIHVAVTPIGILDLHLGVQHWLRATRFGNIDEYRMSQYMFDMYNKNATHVKSSLSIYHQAFHYPYRGVANKLNQATL